MMAPSRAHRALQFMQSCRRAPRPRIPASTRDASQFQSQVTSSHSSPYDPSNFSKALQRPRNLDPPPSYHYPRAVSPPTQQRIPGYRPSIWTAIKSIFGWKPKFPSDYVPAPFTGANNPYRARKKWPPDFRDLHPKKQFHFEKTYRRRAKLAYARPRWNRRMKLLQHTLLISTTVYFVLFAEPRDMGTPFDGFRVWFFGKLKNIGQIPESTRMEIEKAEQEARQIKDSRARKSWFGKQEATAEVVTE